MEQETMRPSKNSLLNLSSNAWKRQEGQISPQTEITGRIEKSEFLHNRVSENKTDQAVSLPLNRKILNPPTENPNISFRTII